MKNFYFVKKEDGEYEFWVDGRVITDCFYGEEVEELINQLVYFANVPFYKSIAGDIIERYGRYEREV